MNIIEMSIAEVKPYEKNPRKNDQSVDKVANSIKEFGFKVPIVIDKHNVIVCGHTRYKAAKKLGLAVVPCVVADDLTEEQIKAYRLADNKVGEDSLWDMDLLSDELGDILDLDMSDFGFDLIEESQEVTEDDFEEQDRLFKERMAAGEISEEDEEYQEFLDKFELKKTTDDCYTPDNIYEAVRKWVVNKYGLKGKKVIRPFYPGGDYQKEDYSGDCVVIDNPPFSIISEICEWYTEKGIKYFMFAPSLTLLGIMRGNAKYVAVGSGVIYANGANVSTSFVTNMGDKKIIASSELRKIIDEANKENLEKLHRQLPKYSYPDEVLTATMLTYIAAHDTDLEIDEKDLCFIRALDAQKKSGKGLFGSGFLLSKTATKSKTAAEKAAAEKVNTDVWELSEREKEIVESLG